MNDTPRNAVLVGLISLLMIVFIALLLVWKSGLFLKINGYEVVGQFQELQGLLEGAEVRYRGYRVGTVTKIEPQPSFIHVRFLINSDIQIPEGSQIKIVFDGLVGERYMAIVPNLKSTVMVKPGGVLKGYSTSGLSDFIEIGSQNLEETKAILESVRKVITDEKVLASIESAIHNVDSITNDINTFTKSGRIEEAVDNISGAAKSFSQASNRIGGDGDIAQNIAQGSKEFAETAHNVNRISAALATDESIDNMRTILKNMAEFSKEINQLSKELNTLLRDEKIKASILGTLKKGEAVFNQSGSILTKISEIKVKTEANVQHYSYPNDIKYELRADIGSPKSFTRIGIGNRNNQNTQNPQVLQIQQGVELSKKTIGRIGLVNAEPGVGFDYQLSPHIQLTSDLYNFRKPTIDLIGRYKMLGNVDLLMGGNNLLDSTRGYSVGFSVH